MYANTTKYKVMTLLSGRIRTCLSEDAYLFRMDALHRESKVNRKVEYHVCRKPFMTRSLESHLVTQQGLYYSHLVDKVGEGEVYYLRADPQTWTATFLPETG